MLQCCPHRGLSSHRFIRDLKASLAQSEQQEGDVALRIFNDQHAQRLAYFLFRFENCLHLVVLLSNAITASGGGRAIESAPPETLRDKSFPGSSLLLTSQME